MNFHNMQFLESDIFRHTCIDLSENKVSTKTDVLSSIDSTNFGYNPIFSHTHMAHGSAMVLVAFSIFGI